MKNDVRNVYEYTIESSDITIFEAIPNVEGYEFVGWQIDGDDSGELYKTYTIPKGSMGNIKLIAGYDLGTYLLELDLNGGVLEEGIDTSYNLVAYSYYYLPIPTKEGYEFLGWYNGDEKISFEYYFYITKDTKLTAKWEEKNYELVYNYFDGYKNKEVTVYLKANEEIKVLQPTRTGYKFAGWFSEGKELIDGVYPYKENKIFYGVWEPLTYNITYELDGGVLSEDMPSVVSYESSITLPTPTKSGYLFLGWYYNNVKVESGTFKIASDVHLVPLWTEYKNVITYQLDGGINDPKNPLQYKENAQTKIYPPTKTGSKFLGWVLNENDTPVKDYSVPSNQEGNITLIAKWELIDYIITYKIDERTVETQIVHYNEQFTLLIYPKEGYDLIGWYTESEEKMEEGIWLYTENITLIPKIKAKKYIVVFDASGGIMTSIPTMTITYDTYIDFPEVTKEGYEFLGWYYNNKRIDTSSKWTIDIDQDNNRIVARWKIKN